MEILLITLLAKEAKPLILTILQKIKLRLRGQVKTLRSREMRKMTKTYV